MEIEEYAFERCISLKKVTILNCATKIKFKAFAKCSSLEEVIVPSEEMKTLLIK